MLERILSHVLNPPEPIVEGRRKRAFARAVAPNDAKHLALLDPETDIAQCPDQVRRMKDEG